MPTHKKFSWDLFHDSPVIGIVRGLEEDVVYKIADTMLEAKLYTVEVTMNTPDALSIINDLINKFPGMNVGAGTVCDIPGLRAAIDAGAQFIVTPIVAEDVIRQCVATNVPIFPGGFTPTEIYKAWELGASGVKVFPASLLGPDYIRNVTAPLDQIKLIPTGGISLGNISSYFAAGAYGVGMGSSLYLKNVIEPFDRAALLEHFNSVRSEISGSYSPE